MPEIRMRVAKYLPEKLYGFCQDTTGFEVFFHLACFQPGSEILSSRCSGCPGPPQCTGAMVIPPPILGESVLVSFNVQEGVEKAPRATKVVREVLPVMLLGKVETFDPVRRYGFLQGSDMVSYHLHQSEITDGRLPLVGNVVSFFAGFREGRPRACHVRVCR